MYSFISFKLAPPRCPNCQHPMICLYSEGLTQVRMCGNENCSNKKKYTFGGRR